VLVIFIHLFYTGSKLLRNHSFASSLKKVSEERICLTNKILKITQKCINLIKTDSKKIFIALQSLYFK